MIEHPGIYADVPEDAYHSDREVAPQLGRPLSYSGAKRLLESPERFAYQRTAPRAPTDSMDLGTVVHALVLRSGDNRIRVHDVDAWRGNIAKVRDEQRAAGLVPVKRSTLLAASKVARAVRRHPLAGAVLARPGVPEQSMYWRDELTGVTVRGRIDYATTDVHDEPVLVDLKTAREQAGTPAAFGRQAATYDYPMQAWCYSWGWHTLTGVWPRFLTIAVETEPPYIVTVGQYSAADLAAGEARMRRALAEYAERESSGDWTTPAAIHTFAVPGWYGARESA